MSHLVSVLVEMSWFATSGMAHFIQNGCLSGVGIAYDQDSKTLNGLLDRVLENKPARGMGSPYKISVCGLLLRHDCVEWMGVGSYKGRLGPLDKHTAGNIDDRKRGNIRFFLIVANQDNNETRGMLKMTGSGTCHSDSKTYDHFWFASARLMAKKAACRLQHFPSGPFPSAPHGPE